MIYIWTYPSILYMKKLFSLALASLILISAPFTRAEVNLELKLATGKITGLYYPVGSSLCRILNNGHKNEQFKCTVETTEGSLENLDLIADGKNNIGIVQSELLYKAVNQLEGLNKPNYSNLRLLLTLYPESYTLIIREKDARISKFNDLKGKKINIGANGSGSRKIFENLIKKYNMKFEDFTKVTDHNLYNQGEALCSGEVDAVFYVVGHPNASVQDLIRLCKIKFISLDDQIINNMTKDVPYLAKTTIKPGTYEGQDYEVKTIGPYASLVASDKLSENLAYIVTRDIIEHLEIFHNLHPNFAKITQQEMLSMDKIAKYHKGAKKYFQEKGLE